MKKIKVIKSNNLPTKLPLWSTCVWFLMMERFNAPPWLWGALGFVFIVIWGASISLIIKQEHIDLLKNNDEKEKK